MSSTRPIKETLPKKTGSPVPVAGVSSAASAVGWPTCQACGGPFLRHQDGPIFITEKRPLIGDTIFKYTCSRCTSNNRPIFERLPLNWTTVIQLILYHLHRNAQNKGIKVGFFRWKEDICQCIEDHWDWLFPNKTKTPAWANSVSSILSAHTDLFVSGLETLKQPGWWALKYIRPVSRYSAGYSSPPTIATPLKKEDDGDGDNNRAMSILTTCSKRKRLAKTSTADSSVVLSVLPGGGKLAEITPGALTSPLTNSNNISLVANSSASSRLAARSPMTLDTAQTLLLAKHFAERIPPVSALLPAEQEATPTSVRAAQEIKRKLVERLLKVDSKLLKEALANAPVPPGTLISSGTPSLLSSASSRSPSATSSPCPSPPIAIKSTSMTVKSVAHPGSISMPSTPIPGAGNENNSTSNILRQEGIAIPSRPRSTGPPSLKEMKRIMKANRPANYIRASPHENELLELCLRVISPDACVNRLKRKLIMRRVKRRCGISLFDLDQFMYKYLKSADPFIIRDGEVVAVPSSAALKKAAEDLTTSLTPTTFYDIPFYKNPALSFMAKLVGVSNIEGYPWPLTSPFTGNILPPFIHRERIIKPKKMRLLEEIRTFGCPEAVEEETIDFLHVRKEWLGQANRLLSRIFWPAIDMIDSLDYPDYGILAMYRKLVIGCAFITPEGYVTYFAIHPEWNNEGLGKLLMYLLVTKVAPPRSDITLHVSIDNPALILYQRFTFKPEEYVINFYDKYYREDEQTFEMASQYSKHAFLMRYRRHVV